MKDSEHVVNNWQEVGAVEILADRIYPLDPLVRIWALPQRLLFRLGLIRCIARVIRTAG